MFRILTLEFKILEFGTLGLKFLVWSVVFDVLGLRFQIWDNRLKLLGFGFRFLEFGISS